MHVGPDRLHSSRHSRFGRIQACVSTSLGHLMQKGKAQQVAAAQLVTVEQVVNVGKLSSEQQAVRQTISLGSPMSL